MQGQLLKQRLWPRIPEEQAPQRQRLQVSQRSRSSAAATTSLLAGLGKTVSAFCWCLVYVLYTAVSFLAGLVTMVAALFAIPVVLFGTLAIIAFVLHVCGLLFAGLGLV